MNTLENFALLGLLSDARDGKAISEVEFIAASNVFRTEVYAVVDSAKDDFANAFRILGSLSIELHSLQRGINVSVCRAGEKQNNYLRIS